MKTRLILAGIITVLVIGTLLLLSPLPPITPITPVGGVATVAEVDGNDAKIGGYPSYYYGKELSTGTSTVCTIKSPVSTSTLLRTTLGTRTATTTAVTMRLATSSTGINSTTTVKYTFALGSGINAEMSWSPTSTENSIFAPNTYLVWDAQGFLGADSTKFRGTCGAEFIGL
jgi:hypothetical protein